MMSDTGMRSVLRNGEFRGENRNQNHHHHQGEMMELMYRSGSAPPTVEGSMSSAGGLFGDGGGGERGLVSEEEMRSDPAYAKFYYTNVNMNPRLPQPLVSKEDWRVAQRFQNGGGGGGNNNTSLFSDQLSFTNGKRDDQRLAETFQDDYSQARPFQRHPSRPLSRNAAAGNIEASNEKSIIGTSAAQTYASALGASLSRSASPDPLVVRAPSPRIPTAGGGRLNSVDKQSLNGSNSYSGLSSGMLESTDLLNAFSGMNLSTKGNKNEVNDLSDIDHVTRDQLTLMNMQRDQILNKQHHIPQPVKGIYPNMGKLGDTGTNLKNSSFMGDGFAEFHNPALFGNSYMKGSPTLSPNGGGRSNHGLSGYGVNSGLPSSVKGQVNNGNFTSSGVSGMDSFADAAELQSLGRISNQMSGSHVDPRYLQYLKSAEFAALQATAYKQPLMDREHMVGSHTDLLAFQKAYLSLLSSQRSQHGLPYNGKASGMNNGFYGNQDFGFGMQYPGSPLAGAYHQNSPFGPGNLARHGEWNPHFLSGMRDFAVNDMGAWHDEHMPFSLVDEFKSNKTKCFELSEIGGHVVEFSSDQYGSRFIQQKLETATTEEKNMIFSEIMPRAHTLMTDVFGNYVVQKFFEHGSPAQIRELGAQLHGNVLQLSLQMYGCRVIQKAIEVVALDQKTTMVAELEGHIMRCVRDQNGNHVIQKCIECIPEDIIHFIVSTFYDQVVTLSTHPYGCRVIQRVLEHCHDPKTQQIMMDEIMQSVCMLAQDQYGNYVVQHVLEHGKPHERSNIISQLTGQIVQMSQQKFASNVVEKCLTFGDLVERQILVTEILGTTDENEPLQAMMKDQFANYVVQKVMETCDDQQLELILGRIKVHLNALKKYTYGKHIVARVEKLVAAGEKRISSQAMNAMNAAATAI